jgi:hypothetical protein
MIVALFRRRLAPGASFEDFIQAWTADQGFGVPARVFNAVSLEDPREILSVGFVDIDPAALGSAIEGVATQEAARHSRIDEVIESTVFRGFFALETEHDFTAEPRQIGLGSTESLLAALR